MYYLICAEYIRFVLAEKIRKSAEATWCVTWVSRGLIALVGAEEGIAMKSRVSDGESDRLN